MFDRHTPILQISRVQMGQLQAALNEPPAVLPRLRALLREYGEFAEAEEV